MFEKFFKKSVGFLTPKVGMDKDAPIEMAAREVWLADQFTISICHLVRHVKLATTSIQEPAR